MNKLFTVLVVVMLLPLVAFSQAKAERQERKQAFKNREKYLFAAKPVQKNFTHTLQYETTVGGHIIVPITIEDKIYRFIFDTGASTVVSTELRDKLGMKNIFTNKFEDAAGKVEKIDVYQIGEMQLGPVVFKNVAGPAVSLDKIEKQFCEKIDGLFGTNIMRTCYWKIDYRARTITFSDKKIKPEAICAEIDFIENFSGSPLILQLIGERPYYSTMDTGAGRGFRVSDSLFFNSRKSRGAKMVIGRGNSSMALFEGKPSYEYVTIMDGIYVGNNLIKNQLVEINAGESYLTGNSFFEKFGSVILDWKKKKIYLPKTELREDTSFVGHGLLPVYTGDSLRVGMVWENSIDGINEIDPGDIIVSIDGIQSENIPREKWCEIATILSDSKTDKPLSVIVRKKDNSEVKFILKKTDLLK